RGTISGCGLLSSGACISATVRLTCRAREGSRAVGDRTPGCIKKHIDVLGEWVPSTATPNAVPQQGTLINVMLISSIQLIFSRGEPAWLCNLKTPQCEYTHTHTHTHQMWDPYLMSHTPLVLGIRHTKKLMQAI
uniref:Uncharacterized protein n=1 Tax=Electrophorus electricus TaxID=8005 RepID=A0A4W4G4R4_ELEEL